MFNFSKAACQFEVQNKQTHVVKSGGLELDLIKSFDSKPTLVAILSIFIKRNMQNYVFLLNITYNLTLTIHCKCF